jgi:hypothetical protein
MRRVAAFASAATIAAGASIAMSPAVSGAASAHSATSVQPAAASSTVGVNGVCGSIVVGAIPTNLREGGSESDKVRLFRERLNYTVATTNVPVDFTAIGLYNDPSDIKTPKPSIAIGTHVNSYVIHSDPVGQNIVRQHHAATIGFTSDILGVQVLSGTLTEAQAVQLRDPNVQYANNASGLELAVPPKQGDYARLVNRRTLAISFKTSTAVDEVRVITRATTSEQTALKGYRMLAADGGVFDFGGQQFYGSTGGRVLNKPVVAGVNTCSNAGYWFVASDGGVFSYGDAPFYGSLGAEVLTSPVVGMAATATGAGYYMVQANGTVRIFGDAETHGDASHIHLNSPIVGIAVTPSGLGYWLVAGDGGIFSFGDATSHFYGSTGNLHLVSPIIGMFAAVDGNGYYLYAADGGMFVFQRHPPYGPQVHEPFFGSAGGAVRTNPIVGARLAPDGQGYWFDDSAGLLYHFGPSAPAANPADMAGVQLFRPMIGMM